MEKYKQHLIETIGMSEADATLFLSGFDRVSYQKGELLQKSGTQKNVIRILLNGCARGYKIIDGNEFTIQFYFEHDHTYDYLAYMHNQKAELDIVALDDLEVIEMSLEALDFLQTEIHGFHLMSFKMFSFYYTKIEKERQAFIIKKPKDRYLDLLQNNKQVISRIPQHQIATYIGITPVHLSRIRKEIRDNEE